MPLPFNWAKTDKDSGIEFLRMKENSPAPMSLERDVLMEVV